MATASTAIKNFLFKQHSSTLNIDPFPSNTLFNVPTRPKSLPATITLQKSHNKFSSKAITTAAKKGTSTSTGKVQQVYSTEEFDVAKNKLALCEREKIERVPRFDFYKSMEKVHEEEGIISRDKHMQDGDDHSAVIQLHSREDVENLVEEHRTDNKLIVLDVGLKDCAPCVRVYPTVLILSRQLVDTVVFARMNGDENESCMQFLKDMKIVRVPTFLFIRDGDVCGRYVGSCKAELIREVLKYRWRS
ncbi:hypothetical protein MKW94_006932 [Papaver nudicaule]|uniref:Thioredoxin domain-containing protein n=1 Tax=Papaver nudicaule TaxID=74823 RepID=A0AA41UWR0_PAPNU|nr:hypothetical protein [Papaver nudicaule]